MGFNTLQKLSLVTISLGYSLVALGGYSSISGARNYDASLKNLEVARQTTAYWEEIDRIGTPLKFGGYTGSGLLVAGTLLGMVGSVREIFPRPVEDKH